MIDKFSGRFSSLYECSHKYKNNKCVLKVIDFSKLTNSHFSSLNEGIY